MTILAVVVVVVIVSVVASGRQADKKVEAAPTSFACATPDCGFVELRPLQVDETLPLKCPKCGNQTLYVSRKCPTCETAVIMDEDRGQPGPTKCPKCGNEVRHGQ